MKLFKGIIIGWFIGSIVDYILISLDYYGLFESLSRLPRIFYTKGLSTIIGRWLDSFICLILLDHKLNKFDLDEYRLDYMLNETRVIRKEIEDKKSILNLIKRFTLNNIDCIIEDIEDFKRTNTFENENEFTVRKPSLDGLRLAVQEMMDIRLGRKEKVFVERD